MNKGKDVKRYVIPCSDRTLLFVNQDMYNFWKNNLQKEGEVTIKKELTSNTDGFLPILFAASTSSCKTKVLTVAADVCADLSASKQNKSDTVKLFENVSDFGGGRSGWGVYFMQGCGFIYEEFGKYAAVDGTACTLHFVNCGENYSKEGVQFDLRGSAGETIFKNGIKKEIDAGKKVCYISEKWSKDRTHVPISMILEYVEAHEVKEDEKNAKAEKKGAKAEKDVLTIDIKKYYDERTLIGDLKEYLPKAVVPKRQWQLNVNVDKDKGEEGLKELMQTLKDINQKAFRFEAEVKESTIVY